MIDPINIHTKNYNTELFPGQYQIDILGGWSVVTDSFKIKIENTTTRDHVLLQYTKWPVQSFAFGQRAKRYYEIEITTQAFYSIHFINPTDILVKHSNLPFISFFFKEISNEKISIYIHRKC